MLFHTLALLPHAFFVSLLHVLPCSLFRALSRSLPCALPHALPCCLAHYLTHCLVVSRVVLHVASHDHHIFTLSVHHFPTLHVVSLPFSRCLAHWLASLCATSLPCCLFRTSSSPHVLPPYLATLCHYLEVPSNTPPFPQFVASLPHCLVAYWLVVGISFLPLLLQGRSWNLEKQVLR